MDRAARRRAERARAKSTGRMPSPAHVGEPSAVLRRLDIEATRFGIDGLIKLPDDAYSVLDSEMIAACRLLMSWDGERDDQDRRMITMVLVHACMAWARAQEERTQEVGVDMMRRCGLRVDTVDRDEGKVDMNFGVADDDRFAAAGRIVVNRLALINR